MLSPRGVRASRGGGPVSPGARRGFAEKLDALLAAVPRKASSPGERFTAADVIKVLASVDVDATEADAIRAAEEWLAAMRSGTGSERDRHYLRALAALFRVPLDYFDDDVVAAQVDARIAFAVGAASRGIRFIGPCRAASMDVEPLHDLHVLLVDVLDRHASQP